MSLYTFASASLALLCLLAATNAHSHARWNPESELKPRHSSPGIYPTDVKTGPCGGLPRIEPPVEFTAGSTITVEFQSNIYHQGVFRIAFSPANDEGFDQHVLMDNIPDYPNQTNRSVEITLPTIPCDACTLQLIQTMPDRNPPTNYFSCTDIRLTSNEVVAPDAPSDISISQEGSNLHLSWSSPHPVVIFESTTDQAPQPQLGQQFAVGDSLGDATVIHSGTDGIAVIERDAPGQTYFYSFYAFDEAFQYSEDATASITLETTGANNGGGAFHWTSLLWLFGLLWTRIIHHRRSTQQ